MSKGKEVTQMAMTMAEFVREEGRAEGRAEGEARGRADALRLVLISNLEFKFGPLPASALASIERAGTEELLAWNRQAMVAATLSEVRVLG